MANKVVLLEELRDSRLLYKKDMPKFSYYLLFVIFVFCIIVFVWSINTKKPYIVIAKGTLQCVNKSYVMSEHSGRIYDLKIKEGEIVKHGDVLFKVKSNDVNNQIKQLQTQQKSYESRILKYSMLVESIKKNHNQFSRNNKNDSLYYSQYEEYRARLEQETIDEKTLKGYGYSQKEINKAKEDNKNARRQIRNEAIESAASVQEQYQQEVDNIESQITVLKKTKSTYKVRANISGKIHMLGKYTKGVIVEEGTVIASILDINNGSAIIDATVTASDRSRIKIGNKVKIAVSGLQENVYGTIKGQVKEIDTDVSADESGQNPYFKIRIKPEKNNLNSKDGETINLENGMAVECRIIYDKISYFNYFLDAIGVKKSFK